MFSLLRRVAAAALAVLVIVAPACRREAPAPPPPAGSDTYLAPDSETIEGTVPRDATFETLLKGHKLRPDRLQAVLALIAQSFDPRKLRAKQSYRLVRTFDGLLRELRVEIDLDRYLHVAPASPLAPDDLAATVVAYKREDRIAGAVGTIDKDTSSLFAAMQAAGENDDLSLALAAVFGGEIDFNNDLQPGDAFRLAFEKITRETGTVSYGAILTAEFQNDGRRLRAFRFVLPDGKAGYYDEHGRSLRRFFLKSPLKFEPRVTSRFSYSRLHPVLHVRRAHLGVDYAAPIGASVNAVSNGVVVAAGFAGGAGRLVRLRHSQGYETMYMHLSSIAVRVGQRVSQGDLVGRVGSSGLSTGPHLDYRVLKNGVYVNPLTEHRRMPPGEPIPANLLASFQAERDKLAAQLPPAGTPAVKADAPPQAAPPGTPR